MDTSAQTSSPDLTPIEIDVWIDFSCPYSYVGFTELSRAMANLTLDAAVMVRYHSYLLNEESSDSTQRQADQPSQRYHTELRQERAKLLIQRGTGLGLEIHFARTQPTDMYPAHRLAHFAVQQQRERALIPLLFEAYFTKGLLLSDPEVLVDLAAQAGLEPEQVRGVLTHETFADLVDRDLALAQNLGITAVPFFIFNQQFSVTGAQTTEQFQKILEQLRQLPHTGSR